MTAERKIFISAAIYAILGLVAGLFGEVDMARMTINSIGPICGMTVSP